MSKAVHQEGKQITSKGLSKLASGVKGKPYSQKRRTGEGVWGDCSSSVSVLANYSSGRKPFGERTYTGALQPFLKARGFKSGFGGSGSLTISWYHKKTSKGHKGHTVARVPDGTDFEMTPNVGRWGNVKRKVEAYGRAMHLPASHFGNVQGGSESKSPTVQPESGTVVVTAGALNVRSGPGTNHGKIGVLKQGAKVSVQGSVGNWYKIDYKGQEAYISKKYTRSADNKAEGSSQSGSTVSVTASALNVRSGPGTNHGKIGVLKQGAKVSVQGSVGNWYKIDYNGKVGYISKKYTSGGSQQSSSNSVQKPVQPNHQGSHTPGAKPRDYKQYSEPWGPKMYSSTNNSSQTYAKSACGPTSAADIIATKVNSSVTPYTLGQWAIAKGYRTKNQGTSWGFFPAVASHYGLSCQSTKDLNVVRKGLSNGGLAVASMGKGHWTKGGHFICVYWCDDSTVYANDPASPKTQQKASQFKKEVKNMWIFK